MMIKGSNCDRKSQLSKILAGLLTPRDDNNIKGPRKLEEIVVNIFYIKVINL